MGILTCETGWLNPNSPRNTPSIARSVNPRLGDHCHLPPWYEKRRCDELPASTRIHKCEESGGGNRRLVNSGGWNRSSILTSPPQEPMHTGSTPLPRTAQSTLAHALTEIVDGALEPFAEFCFWLPGQFLTELARINHAPHLFAIFGWPMDFLACRIRVGD